MIHQPHLIAEIRELPAEDGWTRGETTGRACSVCPCGLNTGFVDAHAAIDAYRRHVSAGQKIRVHVDIGAKGAETVARDVVRRLLGR